MKYNHIEYNIKRPAENISVIRSSPTQSTNQTQAARDLSYLSITETYSNSADADAQYQWTPAGLSLC